MDTAQINAALSQLQRMHEVFLKIGSVGQLTDAMVEAGSVYYELMQAGQVSSADYLQELGQQARQHRSHPMSQDLARHCYLSLWMSAADTYSKLERTLLRTVPNADIPPWTVTRSTQAPDQPEPTVTHESLPDTCIVQTTNWEQDFAEQGHRYAHFISELLADLQVKVIPVPGISAELRKRVEEWFEEAHVIVGNFRAIRQIAFTAYPYSASKDRNEREVLQYRSIIQEELKSLSRNVSQQDRLLHLLEQNKALNDLSLLAFSEINCDFSTGRYAGGRLALAVIHRAALDVAKWAYAVSMQYDFKDVLPESPTVSLDKLGYREILPGEEPVEGYYAWRQRVHELKQLRESCPLDDVDLQNITARLVLEQSKMLRILEQRQQHEEQLNAHQRAIETQQRLLMLLEKQEQVKPQTGEAQVDAKPQATEEQPQAGSKTKSGRKRTEPQHHVNNLRQKIRNGYTYPGSYVKLKRDIGGSVGTWTNIFDNPENKDLVDWRDNRSVCARNSLAVEQAGYVDDEFLPDEELEPLFAEQVKRLPEKDQELAWEQYRKMSLDQQRRYIAGSRS